MSHSLAEIAAALSKPAPSFQSEKDVAIVSVEQLAAKVTPGSLYVAINGRNVDGHTFVDEAFARGAVAAVVEHADCLRDRPGIVVANSRVALSRIAALLSDSPSSKLKLIGITGTNGKTTTNYLIYNALIELGVPALRIGTLGAYAKDLVDIKESLTTPEALELQPLLQRAVVGGVSAAVLEVSSQGLEQSRVDDVSFDVAVYTNLTQDHLDYHGDIERYFLAKMRFFEILAKSGKGQKLAVINADCSYGARAIEFAKALGIIVLRYGRGAEVELQLERFSQSVGGSILNFKYQERKFELQTKLIGSYNADNLLATIGALTGVGFQVEEIVTALEHSPNVPGRMEAVGGSGVSVYVDYAHTPDALEKVLRALRELASAGVTVVFGCGGDRDRTKRPLMGAVASKFADRVVVTSDNPRTEDPQGIIDQILAAGFTPALVEVDRERAIRLTLERARPGEVVLIAGKGHEDYQIIGTTKTHFSDAEIVKEWFSSRGKR